jgi:hypothetical protein
MLHTVPLAINSTDDLIVVSNTSAIQEEGTVHLGNRLIRAVRIGNFWYPVICLT